MSTSSVVTLAPDAVTIVRGLMSRPFSSSTRRQSWSMSTALRMLSGIGLLRVNCDHTESLETYAWGVRRVCELSLTWAELS